MSHSPLLAPSILAGNHANLSSTLEEIDSIEQIQWVHLDIMDGHFVPNITFGPQTVAQLRPHSDLYFDTHLMLDNPQDFIEPFIEAGSNNITVHAEPNYDIGQTLERIRELGADCGLSINPETEASELFPYLDQVDMVLIMSVNPGFGGQSFIANSLEKIRAIDEIRKEKGLGFRLEVDGGINPQTAQECINAGADTIVAGTSFFKEEIRPDLFKVFNY